MTKATDAQIRQTQEAIADGSKPLPTGMRINFGDEEPIQKAGTDAKASESRPDDGKK